MTAQELLQQALEALETCATGGYCDIDRDFVVTYYYDENKTTPALDAIRAHLAQPQGEPVAYIRKDQLSQAQHSPMLCEVTREPRQDRIAIYTHPAHTEAEVQAIINSDGDIEGVVRHFLRVPAPQEPAP